MITVSNNKNSLKNKSTKPFNFPYFFKNSISAPPTPKPTPAFSVSNGQITAAASTQSNGGAIAAGILIPLLIILIGVGAVAAFLFWRKRQASQAQPVKKPSPYEVLIVGKDKTTSNSSIPMQDHSHNPSSFEIDYSELQVCYYFRIPDSDSEF